MARKFEGQVKSLASLAAWQDELSAKVEGLKKELEQARTGLERTQQKTSDLKEIVEAERKVVVVLRAQEPEVFQKGKTAGV